MQQSDLLVAIYQEVVILQDPKHGGPIFRDKGSDEEPCVQIMRMEKKKKTQG
jgi:hypothetical protein